MKIKGEPDSFDIMADEEDSLEFSPAPKRRRCTCNSASEGPCSSCEDEGWEP